LGLPEAEILLSIFMQTRGHLSELFVPMSKADCFSHPSPAPILGQWGPPIVCTYLDPPLPLAPEGAGASFSFRLYYYVLCLILYVVV